MENREGQTENREGQMENREGQTESREGQMGSMERLEGGRERQMENRERQIRNKEKQAGNKEEQMEYEEMAGEWESAEEWEETGEWEGEGSPSAGFRSRKKRKRGENRLTGSMLAKIVAFFLLGASSLVGIGAAIICAYMGMEGAYTENLNTVMINMMRPECARIAYRVENSFEEGDIQDAAEMFQQRNLGMELIYPGQGGESGKVVWSTWDGGETSLTTEVFLTYEEGEKPVRVNGHTLQDNSLYVARLYVDPDFPWDDSLKAKADAAALMYENRYIITGAAVAGIFLCLVCFLFLMCGAGHRNGSRGIVPGALTTIHLDVLTLLFGGGALVFCTFVINLLHNVNTGGVIAILTGAGTILVVWMTFYCMDFAVRVKIGKCWRYSIIFIVMRWLWRCLRFFGRGLVQLFLGLPLVISTLNVYAGICIVELIAVIKYVNRSEGLLLWALEKAVLLPVILYIALAFRKLLKASRALAQGQGNYQVDTSRMVGAFREHGENLNSLALGISKAVEERTKSERMKTELISNVSHDLKTPLTSIINYADLIWEEVDTGKKRQDTKADGCGRESGRRNRSSSPEETGPDSGKACETTGKAMEEPEKDAGERAGEVYGDGSVDVGKVREYAEVLLRQSRRLKKLMEDLMEASKATTGNLEVNLEPCEVGVLLSQAVGEYQQKMGEKELELIARQPEEAAVILADGRRLWRIFENLLNNICKYAQEGSRVYLSVEVKEERVLIIFRNMSKYPLDISGEELEERFVRGDKSRHMEGNGLGLSIAKSLVELQNGRMEIVIDGDLFKVVLSFPRFPEGGYSGARPNIL